VHFINADGSVLFKPREHGPEWWSFAIELGPSIAIVDHTFTNGDPAHCSGVFCSDTRLEAPLHATVGGNVGLVGALHINDFVCGLAFGYRGGIPINAGAATWEGAIYVTLSLGIGVRSLIHDAPPKSANDPRNAISPSRIGGAGSDARSGASAATISGVQ